LVRIKVYFRRGEILLLGGRVIARRVEAYASNCRDMSAGRRHSQGFKAEDFHRFCLTLEGGIHETWP